MLCYPVLTILGAQPENFQEAVEYYQVRTHTHQAYMEAKVLTSASLSPVQLCRCAAWVPLLPC